MTYNQVQSFQINDYVNHYVDIEITGYRALYSKSIVGRGVTRLISWLDTAGPLDCFNKSLSDSYISVYRSFLAGYSQLLVEPTLGYAPKTRHSTNLQVYLRDHVRQLEYSKQYSIIKTYYRFVFTSAHYPFQSKPPRSCYQK